MLAALLFALAPAAQAADPAPVVAAERAFASDGAANGVKASFLRWMAPDAIVFAPDPVSAREVYGKRPDGKGAHVLTWRPSFAGLAASAELGFTTGPFAVDGVQGGYYFTIWAKQPDGSWKWIYDGGTDDDAVAPEGVAALAGATGRPLRAEAAMSAVRRAEARLARTARRDAGAAYAGALSGDAVRRKPPTKARAIAFAPLGGRASKAGDLVWTYGDARWEEAGKPRRGHYVRVWRNDRAGFRIVFDELLPVS